MGKTRFVPVLVGIALLLLIVTQLSDVLCSVSTNIALLQLSNILTDTPLLKSMMTEEQEAISCSPICQGASIGPSQALVLGYKAWLQGNIEDAMHTWDSNGADVAQSFTALGRYFYLREQYQETVFWYESLLSINPEDAEAWHILAEARSDLGRWDEAAVAFQKAVELGNADSVTPYLRLLSSQELHDERIGVLITALDAYPSYPDRLQWWRDLTTEFRAKAQWEDTLDTAEQALLEFPDDFALLTDYAYALYYVEKDLQTSCDILTRAIDINPQYSTAYGRMGEIMFNAEHYKEASNWYAEAKALSPAGKWWYVGQARAVMQAGHPEQAIVLYQETVKTFPDFAYGYFELAKAYYTQGNVTSAHQSITIAIKLQQPSLPAYYVLAGQIQISLGDPEAAKNFYYQALEIQPDYSAAIKELEFLQAQMDN